MAKCLPEKSLLRWKLQRPLNRLKSPLLTQGIQVRFGLEGLQARIPQPQRRVERFERLCPIAPLRIDRGVLVRCGIAIFRLQFRKLGFRICAEVGAVPVPESAAQSAPATAFAL